VIPVSSAFQPGRKSLIVYLTVGYPSIETTLELIPALAGAGCDAIELGIPFSDPLADGSTIQRAAHLALQQGVTTKTCPEAAAAVSASIEIPLLFMGYYNPMLRYGLEAFCAGCAATGVGGLIVPDLPPEEGALLQSVSRGFGISMVYLVAPTTPDDRLSFVARNASGFLYLVSLAGVTGARASLPAGLETFVGRVRKVTCLPLAVGFGVSTSEQAARIAAVADGVIVGSALLATIDNAINTGRDPVKAAGEYARNLRTAIDEAKPTGR
jgi:tryptophan synthase alpha chain